MPKAGEKFRKWSKKDDIALHRFSEQRVPDATIAKKLHRTRDSITYRRWYLKCKMTKKAKDLFALEERYNVRIKLNDERVSLTHRFKIHTSDDLFVIGYLHVGLYGPEADAQLATMQNGHVEPETKPPLHGRPGEIFLQIGKPGDIHASLDQWAIAFSLALQHQADFEPLCRKFVGTRFVPSGDTDNPAIPRCTSVVDYVCRWLLMRYGREGF